jgi:hypothetical protein
VTKNTSRKFCRQIATLIAKFLLRASGGAALIGLNKQRNDPKLSRYSNQENPMKQPATQNQPNTAPPMMNEDDIGSGEKTPAQKETEEMIRQIPPLPASDSPATPGAPRQP